MENRKRKKSRHTLLWIIFIEILLVLAGLAIVIFFLDEGVETPVDQLIKETMKIDFVEETTQTPDGPRSRTVASP